VGAGYLDAFAKASASETCMRCAGRHPWKSAALIYETMEWDYFYCHECRKWYKRHFKLRYIVANVDDKRLIRSLTSQVNFGYDILMEPARDFAWLKAELSKMWRALRYFGLSPYTW
jgi:hypothetical protein